MRWKYSGTVLIPAGRLVPGHLDARMPAAGPAFPALRPFLLFEPA